MQKSINGFDFNKQPLEWLNDKILETMNKTSLSFIDSIKQKINPFVKGSELYFNFEFFISKHKNVEFSNVEFKYDCLPSSSFEIYGNYDNIVYFPIYLRVENSVTTNLGIDIFLFDDLLNDVSSPIISNDTTIGTVKGITRDISVPYFNYIRPFNSSLMLNSLYYKITKQ